MLYSVIILAAVAVVSVFGWIVLPFTYLEALFFTACATAAVVVLDALTASLSRSLPKKCVPEGAKIFKVGAKEKRFYERLKIRKWKDKVPEIGHFTGFRKNKIDAPKDPKYIDRFLLECRYGEVGHFFSCIVGFLIVIPLPFLPAYWWALALPVAIVNAAMNLPSLFILRYNSYKLVILQKSLQKKEK